eukprot:4412612-Pyramimonas_sp.AAC.1
MPAETADPPWTDRILDMWPTPLSLTGPAARLGGRGMGSWGSRRSESRRPLGDHSRRPPAGQDCDGDR